MDDDKILITERICKNKDCEKTFSPTRKSQIYCSLICCKRVNSRRHKARAKIDPMDKGTMLTHGMSQTKLYKVYMKIIGRCENVNDPTYKYYGAEGKKMCKEWRENFLNFYKWANENGYRDKLTIERKDNNGNYEPLNCMWATKKEQANNRRTNHYLTFNGETLTIAQWSDKLSIKQNLIERRINLLGWDAKRALTKPVRPNNPLFTFNNKTQSIGEWAKEFGFKFHVVYSRIINCNWTIEKALTTPVKVYKC